MRSPQHGLSLIELLVALAIVVVLAGLSLPNLQRSVLTARRSDALSVLGQVELAQARFRSQQLSYATLSQLGVKAASPSGHYRLSEGTPTEAGYAITAAAQGGQANDAACRFLLLRGVAGGVQRLSGATPAVDNDEPTNRKCWGA